MKKIIYILFLTLIIVIITLNVLSIYNLSLFGIKVFKICSGSMEPYLKINSLIIVKEFDDYQVNDVVTFKEDGETITHRIISINGEKVITKGDANNMEDEPIERNKIIGKVILKINSFSIVNYCLSRPYIWISIHLIGGLLIYIMPDKKHL